MFGGLQARAAFLWGGVVVGQPMVAQTSVIEQRAAPEDDPLVLICRHHDHKATPLLVGTERSRQPDLSTTQPTAVYHALGGLRRGHIGMRGPPTDVNRSRG